MSGKRIFAACFCFALFLSGTLSAEESRLFSLSFDKGVPEADFSKGSSMPQVEGEINLIEGVEGKGIVLSKGSILKYPFHENINPSSGTIEIWIEPLTWDGRDKSRNRVFFNAKGLSVYRYGAAQQTWIGFVFDGKSEYIRIPSSDWRKGKWYQVVVTWDKEIKVFINGFYIDRYDLKGKELSLNGEYFSIGSGLKDSDNDTGFDSINIFGEALSEEAIFESWLKFQKTGSVPDNSEILAAIDFKAGVVPGSILNQAVLFNPESLTIEEDGCVIGKGYSAPVVRAIGWDGSEGSLAFWMKPVDWDADFKESVIIFRPYEPGENKGFLFYNYASRKDIYLLASGVFGGKQGNEVVFSYEGFKDWVPGEWHHVALTWKKDAFIRLYVDGKLTNKREGGVYFFPGSLKGFVFSKGIFQDGWGCEKKTILQDVRLVSRPLFESEIAGLAKNKPGEENEVGSFVNILPFSYTGKPPVADGNIQDGEYPTKITGLIDTKLHTVYPEPHYIYTAYDEKFIYIGATIKIPQGHELKSLTATRDDPVQISGGDLFAIFLRADTDVDSQTYKGYYITIAPNGNIYDCREEISWKEMFCHRYAEKNLSLEVKSIQGNDIWSLEVRIPLDEIGIKTDKFLVSAGMQLGDTKLGFRDHPAWFDHYQAFSYGIFTRTGVDIFPGDLTTGRCNPKFLISNAGDDNVKGKVRYKIATYETEVTFESMAEEVHIGKEVHVREKKPLFFSETDFEIAKNGKSELTPRKEYFLGTPDAYLLETQVSVDDIPVFYQVLPFVFYPPITVNLKPVPSRETVKAIVSLHGVNAGKNRIGLVFTDAGGKEVLREAGIIDGKYGVLNFSMAELSPGQYKVKVFLEDKITAEVDFEKLPEPVWAKERKGIEALNTGWVPAPWTPIEVKGDTINLWGRVFDIGEGSLIKQIKSQGESLLSSPWIIKYTVDGKEYGFTVSAPEFKFKDNGQAELVQKGEAAHFTFLARQRIEFDGFDTVNIGLSPKSKVNVEKLWMELNLPDNMKYLVFLGDGFNESGRIEEKTLDRVETIWVGNDKAGLMWFAESYKGWVINSQKPRVNVKRGKDRWTVDFMFVNELSGMEKEINVRFALQPTPVKPCFENWREIRPQGWGFTPPPTNLVMTGEGRVWTTTNTMPYPRNGEVLNEMVKYVRQFNQKVYPYLNPFAVGLYESVKKEAPFFMSSNEWEKEYGIAEQSHAPKTEYFYYAEDWDITPPYIQESGRWKAERAFCSPDSSFSDYFAYGVYEILTKSDLDGFYFDLAVPRINYDKEKGFGYYTKDGKFEGTREIFAARDHYKRIYYLFDKYRGIGRKPYILGHGSPQSPYSSFWDMIFCGEGVKPKKEFEFTKYYLQEILKGTPVAIPIKESRENYELYPYRAFFNTGFNMPTLYLPQYGYVTELGTEPRLSRELLSITFVHNNILWPAYIPSRPVYDFWNKVEIPFGMGDTVFYPYWENGIKTNRESIKVSYWKKDNPEKYLVAVANWSDNEQNAVIRLPAHLMKYGAACDMEKGEEIVLEDIFNIEVPAHDLRVFFIE